MIALWKFLLAFVGLLVLATVFPFTKSVFDSVSDNGTGALYAAGGTSTNNAFITFLPIGIPIMFFVFILLYVIKSRSSQGGQQ